MSLKISSSSREVVSFCAIVAESINIYDIIYIDSATVRRVTAKKNKA